MYQALNLNYDNLAKHHHKGPPIKHFRHFLNISITITTEERGTNDILVPVSIATRYAWNSAPIDGTDICRSILANVREYHITIEINLNSLPKST